jgi:ELWxxDGT repeat protein
MSKFIFGAGNQDGSQLWILTVAPSGTATAQKAVDLYPTYPSATPLTLAPFGGGFLFTADGSVGAGGAGYTPTHGGTDVGYELWFTDGTQAGTHLVQDIFGGTNGASQPNSSDPFGLTVLGGEAVFGATDSTGTGLGTGLWVTNGAAGNASRITGLSYVSAVAKFGSGQALVAADNSASTAYVWLTNGTQGGTHQVASLPGLPSTFYVVPTAAGGQEAFFVESEGLSGANAVNDLWVTDGTAGGTQKLATFTAPSSSANAAPTAITAFGSGAVLFVATDTQGNQDLWTTNANLAPLGITPFTTAGGKQEALFETSTGQLWVTDGTAGGTAAVAGATVDTAYNRLFALGHDVFFTAYAGGKPQLWMTDGTAAGTQVFDAAANLPAAYFTNVVGGELFFTTYPAATGTIGVTDSTAAGTHLFSNVAASGFEPQTLAVFPCFLAGTRIATPGGEVAVERLRAGERVLTQAGAAVPVQWVGERRVDCRRHPAPQKVWPVRIRAGAFADAVPSRDLLLSPDHAVYAAGVLIPVKLLVNGDSIVQEPAARAHYFHVELPLHDVVLAEGLPVESFLDTGNRAAFANGDAAPLLHPDFAALHWENACAPLVVVGPELAAVRAALQARAAASGGAARAA